MFKKKKKKTKDSGLEAFAIIFMLNLKFEKSWSANLKNLRVSVIGINKAI
jgi:hypothetical protein